MRDDVVLSEQGYLLYGPWLAKDHSKEARLVRRQWSGNEKRVILGAPRINLETKQFRVIDFRVYDPWRRPRMLYHSE
ncbi:MAG: hypothetical protein M3511_09350 [Deinococcota bacterium]|nr:hypothetical protein [Deinococcota bacterium]